MDLILDALHNMPTLSQCRKYCRFMIISTLSRFTTIFISLAVIILFLYAENLWSSNTLSSSAAARPAHHETCVWKQGDPQLFQLKTSSGVETNLASSFLKTVTEYIYHI